MDFTGRSVLVTGAGGGRSGGIGFAVSRLFAQAGADLVINDIDESRAELTVAELSGSAGRISAFAGDVSDIGTTERIIAACVERNGGLDVLVNSAGIAPPGESTTLDPSLWEATLRVNLSAAYYLSRAAIPAMAKGGRGRIVHMSSLAAIRMSLAGSVAYTASKSGILGLTRHLAVEYARAGVTVNAILPGPTMTQLLLERGGAALEEQMATVVPRGRMCTPEEIASLALYLATDLAGMITGAAIPVDGGMAALPGDHEQFSRHRLD